MALKLSGRIEAAKYLRIVARMSTEAETYNGFTSEDSAATLNALIEQARDLMGIDPRYPKVYCIECGTSADECDCES
jgi:hypothetical protein